MKNALLPSNEHTESIKDILLLSLYNGKLLWSITHPMVLYNQKRI